jgi:O-antigen ligase
MLKIILFLTFISSLFLISFFIRKEISIKLMLITIFLCIGTTTQIRIDFKNGEWIYIHSLFLVLISSIILLLLMQKKLIINNLLTARTLIILIIPIYIVFLHQYAFGEILDTNLFTRNLIVFLVLGLLVIFFSFSSSSSISVNFIEKLILYFSIYNSLLGVLQYITNKKLLFYDFNSNIEYYEGLVVVKRAVGLVGVNNGAGNLGAILFSVLLFIYMRNKKKIYLVALLLDLIFILLTFTRIAYLAITITLVIAFCSVKMTKKTIIIRSFLLIFLIFIVFVGGILYFDDIYKILFEYRGHTEAYRFFQFSVAFSLIKNNFWLGVGSGNYSAMTYHVFGIPNDPVVLHSQWLNVLTEQGFISFICFVAFNIYLLYKLLTSNNVKNKAFPISLFITNFIVSNFNPNQYYELNIFIYYICVLSYIYLDGESEQKIMVTIQPTTSLSKKDNTARVFS